MFRSLFHIVLSSYSLSPWKTGDLRKLLFGDKHSNGEGWSQMKGIPVHGLAVL